MEFYEESEKKEFSLLGKQFNSVHENIKQSLATMWVATKHIICYIIV